MGNHAGFLKFICFLAVLPLSLSSCEKDELTKPVEVYFSFKLDRVPQPGAISFQSGTFDLKSITFIGDRATGEDISFTSDFETIVHADLGTGNADPVIKFDLPQGNYDQITLAVNPDDMTPDITIIGKYIPTLLGPSIPVQLEIDIAGQLNLMGKAPDGNANIVLRKDASRTVDVFLNPSLWFTDIPLLSLQTAELQTIGGVPSILISKTFNQAIYSDLLSLIEVSAEGVFN